METSTVPRADLRTIVDNVDLVAKMILVVATKEGGMHPTSSARAIGASVKYIGQAKDAYRGNLIVEGTIERISHWRGETDERFDYKTIDSAEVMRNVDALAPVLDAAGEQGAQTKAFLYGIAGSMVNASGSGFMGTGPRLNENEARFLADLKAHLGV